MSELTLLADADERGRRYLAETAQRRVFLMQMLSRRWRVLMKCCRNRASRPKAH